MATKQTKKRKSFWADFRQFFVRGLAVLLPSVLTLWILFYAYRFVNASVAEPINAGIRQVVLRVAPRVFTEGAAAPQWYVVTDEQLARERAERPALRPMTDRALTQQVRARNFRDWWNDHWYLRLIGLMVAIVLIYLAGLLLGGFIGRRIYDRFDELMARVPVLKLVYPHVKQVVEFLFGESQKVQFNRVVLVEYPRKGIWSVGLMTGGAMRDAETMAGGECITIFIPSSPTPFTGYTITVRREDAIDLPITIDEALRFVVSGGVLVPDKQLSPNEARRSPSVDESRPANLASGPPPGMMGPNR